MIRFLSVLFALMAVMSPWFIGGNYPFTRTIMIAGCGLALTLLLLELLNEQRRGLQDSMSIPWIWWVLLLGVGLTAFQACPQSASVQSKFGQPNRIGLGANSEKAAVGGSEQLASSFSSGDYARSISVYAPATRSKLVDLLYGVSLFICASLVLKTKSSVVTVFASLAAVGSLVSFVGVLQILSGDSRILWQYELLWGGDPFASFVNGNNAAGFLLICFAASMFFIAQMPFASGKEKGDRSVDRDSFDIDEGQSFLKRFLKSCLKLQSQHLYCLTAIAVIATGAVMTGSRGGMLALVASIVLGGLMLSRTNLLAAVSLTFALIVSSVVMIGYVEQGERVSDEIQTLADFSDAAAPRFQHWQDAIPFGWENVALGTGNGTYRYVSPGFQQYFTAKTFAHAENVYIETLVEMGALGLLLLALCIVFCFYACVSLLRREAAFDRALGISGITCLVGQVAIAVLDFGIYQPANCTAMALVMAAVVGRHSRTGSGVQRQSKNVLSSIIKFGVVTVLALATCWAGYESWGIESRRSAKRSIKLLNRYASEGPKMTRQISLAAVNRNLEQAERIRPDDADVQFLLGDLGICQFRLKGTKRMTQSVRDGLTELETLDLPLAERDARREQLERMDAGTIWSMSAIALLHQQLRLAQRTSPQITEEILNNPNVREHLPKSLERYKRADQLMGRLPHARVKMAKLVALCDLGEVPSTLKEERRHIDEALSRSIPKTQTLFSCGLLALNSGDQDLAVELWQKCLRQPHLNVHESAIVEFSLQVLPMKRLYEEVLPQKPSYLIRIARRYLNSPEYVLPQKFLIVHVRRLINQTEALDKLAKSLLLAQAANLIADYAEVAKNYGAALLLSPQQAPWRYDYAFALYKTKQFDEAVRQLKMCELDPSFRKNRIKRLLDRIRKERSKRSP